MMLYLVRHGESVANKRRTHNRDDERLTERGQAESVAVAGRLREVKLDGVFRSPSQRAGETAEAIAKWHDGVPIMAEPRLGARNSGLYAHSPHGVLHEAARLAGVDYEEFRPLGGESNRDMELRVRHFVLDLASGRLGTMRAVLIVSHAGPIGIILRMFRRDCGSRVAIGNGSLTVIDTEEEVLL